VSGGGHSEFPWINGITNTPQVNIAYQTPSSGAGGHRELAATLVSHHGELTGSFPLRVTSALSTAGPIEFLVNGTSPASDRTRGGTEGDGDHRQYETSRRLDGPDVEYVASFHDADLALELRLNIKVSISTPTPTPHGITCQILGIKAGKS
jgi:hypothetical protein